MTVAVLEPVPSLQVRTDDGAASILLPFAHNVHVRNLQACAVPPLPMRPISGTVRSGTVWWCPTITSARTRMCMSSVAAWTGG